MDGEEVHAFWDRGAEGGDGVVVDVEFGARVQWRGVVCFVDVVLGVVEVGLEDCVPDILGEVFFVGAGWECVYGVGDCA